SWFSPLTNLTQLLDRVLGILLVVLAPSIVHSFLWPDSEAPQLKTRLASLYCRRSDCLAAPHDSVPLSSRLFVLTVFQALHHRVRAAPPGTSAHPLTPATK
ncbi:multidrug transporter subunit MdtO, partial [Klebsiella pneumoniae]